MAYRFASIEAVSTRMTQIVVTAGPACAGRWEEVLAEGVRVVRINAAHGTPDAHTEVVRAVREASHRLGIPVAILLDLAGPKIRVGPLEREPLHLQSGAEVVLVPGSACHAGEVPVLYEALPEEVRPGHRILMADGMVTTVVEAVRGRHVITRVIHGGFLFSRKGVNLPDVPTGLPALTDKDRADLAWGVEAGVDLISLSFVREAEDLRAVRRLLHTLGADLPVIAKLEKPQALQNLEAILAEADAIMVARGDLGVELPLEEIGIHQKEIIRQARRRAIPVITATQVLTSMIEQPAPTRAEVTDITNAILDGTDAIMLSDETARGRYPVEAVRTLRRVIERVEAFERTVRPLAPYRRDDVLPSHQHAVCYAVYELAHRLDVRAILVPTWSGSTVRIIASYRPRQPILAFTPNERTRRLLSLVRGVQTFMVHPHDDLDALVEEMKARARTEAGLPAGTPVVITGGVPLAAPGHTNWFQYVTL